MYFESLCKVETTVPYQHWPWCLISGIHFHLVFISNSHQFENKGT